MKNRPSRSEVRAYICPECGALEGEHCKSANGKARDTNHEERVAKYEADQKFYEEEEAPGVLKPLPSPDPSKGETYLIHSKPGLGPRDHQLYKPITPEEHLRMMIAIAERRGRKP